MPAENMTYDSLVQDVIRYSERNDDAFVAQINGQPANPDTDPPPDPENSDHGK